MTFHRLALPLSASYYLRGNPGPLLPGYDYINDPVGNVTGTTPTPVDTSYKSSGLYTGTYLVAFGEDATASNTNRGLYALAQGQDLMDDYLNESLPRVVTLQVTVPAGPGLATLALTGTIFVGGTGTVNNQPNRDLLVHVLGFTLNEVEVPGVYPAGTRVTVALIHDGASNNVVGTTLSGFYTNPSIDLNVTLPPGTYNIIVGVQTSFADQVISNKAGVIGTGIRGDTGVHADAQRMLRTLHSTVTAPWDANWATTVAALAASGLDGRYRHSTAEPGSLQLDTAGAGAVITRDGVAPEVVSTSVPNAYVDPINAHWIARHSGVRGNGSTVATLEKAATGFVTYSSRRHVMGVGTGDEGGLLGAASFLNVWPHDFTGAGPISARTKIVPGVAGVVIASNIVELGVGQYFQNGVETSVAVGHDLLEVTIAGITKTFVITAIDTVNPRRATLRTLGDVDPGAILVPATAITSFRWLSTLFQQGGGAAQFREKLSPTADPVKWDSFFHAVPPFLTTVAGEVVSKPAEFYARDVVQAEHALEWGGFNQLKAVAAYVSGGSLRGDGSIEAVGYSTRMQTVAHSIAGSLTVNLALGCRVVINLSANITGTFTMLGLTAGMTVELFFVQDGTGGRTLGSWTSGVRFSDAINDQELYTVVNGVTKYIGHAVTNGGLRLYMDKTIYDS